MSQIQRNKLLVVQTARDTGERLSQKESAGFVEDNYPGMASVKIDSSQLYQQIEGFGGAFTEAGAVTLDKLCLDKKSEILDAYFHPARGLGYSLCRTHINSCDFSTGSYCYDDVAGDRELVHFDIQRDQKSLIPFIKAALMKSPDLKIFASPWSPPGWMKTNGQMGNGGRLKAEYRDAWALYFSKYIKAYEAEGIEIWGVTVQNEPEATQVWDSCRYTAEEERDFVRDHLGPRLSGDGLGDIKIMVWDHNKDLLYERAKTILSDPDAAKYVWGTGFHWYGGDQFGELRKTHEAFPEKKLLFTEGCQEGGLKLGSWAVGERYGHAMIGDLNNWTVGWVDWNMVLDRNGGPNYVGNFCDAPVIADTDSNTVYYQSSYYYIGHFSKYIKPGAFKVGCSATEDVLETTAFKNTDGSIAVVVMNKSDGAIPYKFMKGGQAAAFISLPHSIMTLVYQE